MDSILQDLRYAVRALAKSPGFAVIAIVTLALGIGATTAVFSVVDAALFRPLPFPHPDRLVVLENAQGPPFAQFPRFGLYYDDWQAQRSVFDQVAVYRVGGVNVAGGDDAARARTAQVTANFFATIGVSPALGRPFSTSEGSPGNDAVVVLSHGLWQRVFGGNPGIVGRIISLNGRPFTVVGVMPPAFTYPQHSDLWVPLAIPANFSSFDMFKTAVIDVVIARLTPGVQLTDARARVAGVETAYRRDHRAPAEQVRVQPLRDALLGDARTGLLILSGAVGMILLITCTNVAGLLLSRAAGRQHEIALRAALGSSRGRTVRQLLTESLVLSLLGTALGLLFAWWSAGALASLLPAALLDVAPVTVNVRLLIFSLAVCGVATFLFGLAPALTVVRGDLNALLHGGGYRAVTSRTQRARRWLVVGEVGLALMLLIGAGLTVKSLIALESVNPGFTPQNILTFDISLPRMPYDSRVRQAEFFHEVLDRVLALPGVRTAAAVNVLPLTSGSVGFRFSIVGRPELPPGADDNVLDRYADHVVVSPGYFGELHIPLLRGRDFSESDNAAGPPGVVISESIAKRWWPGGNPIGAQILEGGAGEKPMTVIGVVGDVRTLALDERVEHLRGQLYTSYQQDPSSYMTVTVRGDLGAVELVSAVRQAVKEVDPAIPLYDVKTFDGIVAASIAPQHLTTLLLSLAGVLAVLLAVVGVYGVIANGVAQRTREIGVRIALGADRTKLLLMVIRSGAGLTGAGLVAGIVGAWAGSRVLGSLLYHVRVTDLGVFVAAPIVLSLVALVACFVPACRAAAVDPVVALRTD